MNEPTKAELTALRMRLIEELKQPGLSEADTRCIQGQLTTANRQIKGMNIAESLQQRKQATTRKKLGDAQHTADTERALERTQVKVHGRGFGDKPNLGEMIVIRANQLRVLIGRVPAAKSEPHTETFAPQLDAFIEAQAAHCKGWARKAEQKPEDWQDTWKDES